MCTPGQTSRIFLPSEKYMRLKIQSTGDDTEQMQDTEITTLLSCSASTSSPLSTCFYNHPSPANGKALEMKNEAGNFLFFCPPPIIYQSSSVGHYHLLSVLLSVGGGGISSRDRIWTRGMQLGIWKLNHSGSNLTDIFLLTI